MSYKKIQLIHVAKKQIGIDENSYRLLLVRLTGYRSLKDLNSTEFDRVITELKRLGFKTKRNQAEQAELRPQLELIRSLWKQLANNGVVKDSSEMSLNRFIKRMVRVDALQWLNAQTASQVIEHLKKWLKRIEVKDEGKII